MAQRTCLEVIENKSLSDRVRDLLAPLKHLQGLTREEILPAIKAITSGDLEIGERLQVYQFVNAASTFVDPVAKLWNKEIESHEKLPLPLALVWEKLYPTLEQDLLRLLDFEYLIFINHRGLLASARRALLAREMRMRSALRGKSPVSAEGALNAAQQPALKGLVELDSLPWRRQVESDRGWREADQFALNLQNQITHFHLRKDPSDHNQKDQMLRFEVLCQLATYYSGSEERLLNNMKTHKDLQDAIIHLSSQVISKELGTSGIAPRQLTRFATIMQRRVIDKDHTPFMKAMMEYM